MSVSALPARTGPQRRNSKFLARQEEFPATTEVPEAPYAPAGFRPGKAFNLPTEDEEARAAQNPPETTGIPADRYGPPEEPTTTVVPQEEETTDNPGSEVEDLARNTAASGEEAAAEIPDGLYYVQLPTGVQQLIVGVPEGGLKSENIKLAQLVESPPVLVAANAPQSYSYVSQFQTW
ncbi:unnamed protein product [Hermetia illucens]|uniref:DUF4794 domain-containing protein n=1 Tax=Hermetia illucens TaxID=343691 RepID=A0A7R8YRS4_HERIL|nr:unnamed protein product [Hermetia illucens]